MMNSEESQRLQTCFHEICSILSRTTSSEPIINNSDWMKEELKKNESYIRMAYWVVFEREIDSDGVAFWLKDLNNGLRRTDFIKFLFQSLEFQNRFIGDGGWHQILEKLHNARLEMVRSIIPPGKFILDVGGGSSIDPRGSLLNYGYPYLPENIYIVDLPPDIRMGEAAETSKQVRYENCTIEYIYRTMADLTCFPESSFDLIWSGQSIEHITTEEAEKFLLQAYKLLKPGGKLALDTPNRLATKLICPDSYIHPEHKIEYCYQDLCELLEKCNFKVIQSKGIIDLSMSIKLSHMSSFYEEFLKSDNLNNCPETSYCFYICCMRAEDL